MDIQADRLINDPLKGHRPISGGILGPNLNRQSSIRRLPVSFCHNDDVSLYDVIGVSADCSEAEMRVAYRLRARELHPDTAGFSGVEMAELNAAWRELGNVATRARYDEAFGEVGAAPEEVAVPQPAPESQPSRRQAWVAGVQAQVVRLARLAGRSATQTLLLRSPSVGRADYESLVECLVVGLAAETESRVRAARAAGAAPLDLGVAATLVGIRVLADHLRRESSTSDVAELRLEAELLDRMWDILAHELPKQLEGALGGNPRIASRLSE